MRESAKPLTLCAMATILLVEDEEENRLLGTTLLRRLRVDLLIAKNGAEALAVAYDKVPDLILLDISMPVMNGLEVLARLKEDSKTRDIRVIMLTSSRRVEDFKQAEFLGAKGFLSKPYEIDAFLPRICLELGIPIPP